MSHNFISEEEIKNIRAKHLEIIGSSEKFLLDKRYPESFFTSQLLIKLIEKANSPLNQLIINLRKKLKELNKSDDQLVGLINLSNELLETLRIINCCTNYEKRFSENKNDNLID